MGLGGTIPKDGDLKMEARSNDKLREQLLGKDYAKRYADGKSREERKKPESGLLHIGSKPHTIRREDNNGEDDEGRSSLWKSKHCVNTSETFLRQSDHAMLDQPANPPRPSKRASNYLDEVLADRYCKKPKRKRKKQKAIAESKFTA